MTDTSGTEITRFNALKHGLLSRYSVLPWECRDEYQSLTAALVAEHAPNGPTEEHLVEELTGVIWRKRRLRLAEAATFHHGLEAATAPHRATAKAALIHIAAADLDDRVTDAIRSTDDDIQKQFADIAADEAMTSRALDLLMSRRNDAYEAGLAELRDDTRDWWTEMLACDPSELEKHQTRPTADAEGLRHFLEAEVLPWFEKRQQELAHRPLIREQAFGEALNPDKLERLGRYETHLDRKLERTLSMLLRLKDLRRATVGA